MPLAHTPKKVASVDTKMNSPTELERAGPSPSNVTKPTNVRKSVGEWEGGKGDGKAGASRSGTFTMSPKKLATTTTVPQKITQKTALSVPPAPSMEKPGKRGGAAESAEGSPKSTTLPADRVQEGRIWLQRAKSHLNDSRNLRSDIKAGITLAVDNLYRIIKDGAVETEIRPTVDKPGDGKIRDQRLLGGEIVQKGIVSWKEGEELIAVIKQQSDKIDKATAELERLKETVASHTASQTITYASVASQPSRRASDKSPLHSVVIASKDDSHTSDQVLNEVRKAVSAKDGWVTVERVRKVKEKKVLISCKTEEERSKIKERLKSAKDRLTVEDTKNQDPMLVLKDVLSFNTNEDVLKALRNQNADVFKGLPKKDDRIEVKFRRRARNPLTSHIALKVSANIYNRIMDRGSVHVDMQRVQVADQSPLVQCSMCLAYGHSKRFCKDTLPKCSHCGGQHMRAKCADFLAAAPPSCCNCTAAKVDNTEHNAFSSECQVRRRWEALARAKVAYC